MSKHLPSSLSDEGERKALVQEAAERAVEMVSGQTSPPGDSATVRAAIAEHQLRCANDGPVCRVWEEINKMRDEQNAIRIEQTKFLAVIGFWKWALPIVAALVGAGATIITAA